MKYEPTKLIANARAFAEAKHAGHMRKFNGSAYFTHLERVAAMVAAVGGSDEMVAAAYLHDTVEDTATTPEEIRAAFGERVAELVAFLTKVPLEAGNRAKRKELDRARLGAAPAAVHTIKLADLTDNAAGMATEAPKGFAKLWFAETRALVPMLNKGHPALIAAAWAEVEKFEKGLKR